MSLLRTVETTLLTSGIAEAAVGHLRLVACHDGTVEVWPADPTGAPTELGRRRAILGGCLASLQAAGHQVELVCRGDTFVRCRG